MPATIPCSQRRRLAWSGDGSHYVLQGKAIEAMRRTGRDMMDKYKETSQDGLAVNRVES